MEVLSAAAVITSATTSGVGTATVTATEEKKKDYDNPSAVIAHAVTHYTYLLSVILHTMLKGILCY